jgi:hypothetical protein
LKCLQGGIETPSFSKMLTINWMASFWAGLSKSCVMVLLSEIGDKTFFIAAVMAMKNPRGQVGALPQRPTQIALSFVKHSCPQCARSHASSHHLLCEPRRLKECGWIAKDPTMSLYTAKPSNPPPIHPTWSFGTLSSATDL